MGWKLPCFIFAVALSFSGSQGEICPSSIAVPSTKEAERRGCCSHHGGVCSCKDHRTICCDGRPSPTCEC